MDNICQASHGCGGMIQTMIFSSKGNVYDVKEEGKRHSVACDFKNHRLSLFIPVSTPPT